MECCQTCRHYAPDATKSDEGICRRYPPTFVVFPSGLHAKHPPTRDWWICGEYVEKPAVTAGTWTYTGGDSGIVLFTACLQAGAPMAFTPGMRVLEVGAREEDWLSRASETWPECSFVGIDCHREMKARAARNAVWFQGNALEADLCQPESFDAVVSPSAIEHVGLGHYGDPVDPDGDSKAIANIWRWLKPGGWVYFDVPYDPTGYRVQGTECRVYDDEALDVRLNVRVERPAWRTDAGEPVVFGGEVPAWCEAFRGYVSSNAPGTLIPKPTTPHKRYWYVAMVWRKA